MVAWANAWHDTVKTLSESRHVEGVPAELVEGAPSGELVLEPWLARNGLSSQVLDLGRVSHADMPSVLRAADVAVFPNRCEGGTNLVAMEVASSLVVTHATQFIPPQSSISRISFPINDYILFVLCIVHCAGSGGWGSSGALG